MVLDRTRTVGPTVAGSAIVAKDVVPDALVARRGPAYTGRARRPATATSPRLGPVRKGDVRLPAGRARPRACVVNATLRRVARPLLARPPLAAAAAGKGAAQVLGVMVIRLSSPVTDCCCHTRRPGACFGAGRVTSGTASTSSKSNGVRSAKSRSWTTRSCNLYWSCEGAFEATSGVRGLSTTLNTRSKCPATR